MFVYFGYQPFAGCIICKYFLPFNGCFIDGFLCCAEAFKFD